jgi:hypothetical protein
MCSAEASFFEDPNHREKRTELFRFLGLPKSKGRGLLQLFWGEQPPFALLRSVEGGTFFAGFEIAGVALNRPGRRKKSHNRQSYSARCSDKGERNGNPQNKEQNEGQNKQTDCHRPERDPAICSPQQKGRVQKTGESRQVARG